MNIRQFKENYTSNFPSKEEGILRYKHEKLSRITKAAAEFVNLSTTKELRLNQDIETIKNSLPDENKLHADIVVAEHTKSRSAAYAKENIYNALLSQGKIHGGTTYHLIENLSKLYEQKLTKADMNISVYGSALLVKIRKEIFEIIFPGQFGGYGLGHVFITDEGDESERKHEYYHHLASSSLFKARSTTEKTSLMEEFKEERLAHTHKEDLHPEDILLNFETTYIVQALSEKLGRKLIIKSDHFSLTRNKLHSQMSEQEIKEASLEGDREPRYEVYETDEQYNATIVSEEGNPLFQQYARQMEEMTALYMILKIKLYPKYFQTHQQFTYALSITPFSKRERMLQDYIAMDEMTIS